MKVGDLVKMKFGYSPVGVVTDIGGHSVAHIVNNIVDVDPPQMVSIVWPDIGKSREKETDLKVINESR
tara:strand:- start:15 stop:218 length:204 start_codon:yes stop_codon:yes gene_type:complete